MISDIVLDISTGLLSILFYTLLFLGYTIGKIVLSAKSIENIGQKVKNNYNNDKKIKKYCNCLKYLIVILYIVAYGFDILIFWLNQIEYIGYSIIIGFGGVLLIYFFSSRKKLRIKSIAFTAIICIVLLLLLGLPTIIRIITYRVEYGL